MSVAHILSHSSNVGAITLAQLLGRDQPSRWISRFGFGRLTGVDFPGETPGIVLPGAVVVVHDRQRADRPWDRRHAGADGGCVRRARQRRPAGAAASGRPDRRSPAAGPPGAGLSRRRWRTSCSRCCDRSPTARGRSAVVPIPRGRQDGHRREARPARGLLGQPLRRLLRRLAPRQRRASSCSSRSTSPTAPSGAVWWRLRPSARSCASVCSTWRSRPTPRRADGSGSRASPAGPGTNLFRRHGTARSHEARGAARRPRWHPDGRPRRRRGRRPCLRHALRSAWRALLLRAGGNVDGHDLAAEAVAAGAVALVAERPLELGVPCVVVPDSRVAMAPAADLYFGRPTRDLEVAGVTARTGRRRPPSCSTPSSPLPAGAPGCSARSRAGSAASAGPLCGRRRRPSTCSAPSASSTGATAAARWRPRRTHRSWDGWRPCASPCSSSRT